MMRVVVTGASGFIGQNLVLVLRAQGHEVIALGRDSALAEHKSTQVDHIFHLAGANRPPDDTGFQADNVDYAQQVLETFRPRGDRASFNYASTIRVTQDCAYGRSKKAGEELVCRLAPRAGWASSIWRLPNLFGKWCRPYYNSFVSTFMVQAVRGESFSINDPASPVELLYVDDCIEMLCAQMHLADGPEIALIEDFPTHHTTVGEVAALIDSFRAQRDTPHLPDVGDGLARKLHATYLSYLDQEARVFALPRFASETGSFCELFKAETSGQVSALTIAPGETRGNHYHHTKCENFHLVHGTVLLIERDIRGGDVLSREISAGESFWTRPGWIHALTNTGSELAVLVIWANEIYDKTRPDTITSDAVQHSRMLK